MKMISDKTITSLAEIEKRYIEQLWKLFLAVEKSRIEDPHYESLVAEFCNHIEQADSEYRKLGEELSERLSQYANAIYTEVIEIVED